MAGYSLTSFYSESDCGGFFFCFVLCCCFCMGCYYCSKTDLAGFFDISCML